MHDVQKQYKALTNLTKTTDLGSQAIAEKLERLCSEAAKFAAEELTIEEVNSKVPGKRYGVLRRPSDGKRSRPINLDRYNALLAEDFLKSKGLADIEDLEANERSCLLYSMVMSFCAANDILKSGDKKSPGTFFEIFVGHLFSAKYDLNPMKHIQVLNLDADSKLPTDFIFDLGPEKSKIHLPIKLSTRERVVQVWAHQRVLDGVFGTERFKGVLVILAETNYQGKDNSVVEVCLPQQWAVYQMFIARMFRVYYLDVPEKYRSLSKQYPFIQVRDFADFFDEADKIVGPPEAP
ncbi:hypothetical protein [Marinobacter sp. LN3S78]|uniref:hypothetical protein n=1 Tax=Marinobacter sp. LN3S78 TaxID=3382300 RepID=UPI00387B1A26